MRAVGPGAGAGALTEPEGGTGRRTRLTSPSGATGRQDRAADPPDGSGRRARTAKPEGGPGRRIQSAAAPAVSMMSRKARAAGVVPVRAQTTYSTRPVASVTSRVVTPVSCGT